MAQKEKELKVILNGEVGQGAAELGRTLEEWGSQIDHLSRYAREFLTESTDTYRGYEDQMLAARYALSASMDSTNELDRAMRQLESSAQTWASTSIFHTDDVSRAINEAAHAGWDYQEIMEGVPKAMLIAQAGSLELSEGLDYLIKMMNATGTEFADAGTLVDQWAMAANISATNIDEIGEAFLAMGSAAKFGDSTAELFTMLSVLANVGTTGSQAGTALRSAILRVIAPTTKAEDAMEILGADIEEIEEVLADTNVTKAAKELEKLGFSAYNDTGKLKPLRQIFQELFTLTDGLSEAAKNEIISAIFPTRTIATALSLLEATGDEIDGIYDRIENSAGYAEKGAEIMMSGVTGSIETLLSKWEELQRRIGETFSPALETGAEALSNVLDAINGLPDETIGALTGMLTTLAGAGPIALGAGAVIKMVQTLGLGGTLALGAVAGIGALVGYLETASRIEAEGHFGEISLDIEALRSAANGMETQFDTQKNVIGEWNEALNTAMDTYDETARKLSETMLTDVLTGKKLSKTEINNLKQYGNDLITELLSGIRAAETRDLSLMELIFGNPDPGSEADNAQREMGEAILARYEGLEGQARQVGQELRDAMTEALRDGTLDEAERQAIQSTQDRLNQIMAEIQAQQEAAEFYAQERRAQRVSLESLDSYVSENTENMNRDLQEMENTMDGLYGQYKAAFDAAVAAGTEYTTINGEKIKVKAEDWNSLILPELNRYMEGLRQSIYEKYGSLNRTAMEAALNDSDVSESWKLVKELYERGAIDENGILRPENAGTIGMTQEEIQNAYKALDEISKISGIMSGIFSGSAAADSQIATWLSILNGSGSYLNYANGNWQNGFIQTTDGTMVWNPEAARRQEEYAMAYAEAEELQRTNEALEEEIQRYQRQLTETGGESEFAKDMLNGTDGRKGLLEQKAESDAAIAAMQQEIDTMQAALAEDQKNGFIVSTPEKEQNSREYAQAQAELEALRRRQEAVQAAIDKAEGELNGTRNRGIFWNEESTRRELYGDTNIFGEREKGLYEQKAEIDADTEKAEAKVNALREAIENDELFFTGEFDDEEINEQIEEYQDEERFIVMEGDFDDERINEQVSEFQGMERFLTLAGRFDPTEANTALANMMGADYTVTMNANTSAWDMYVPKDKTVNLFVNVIRRGGGGGVSIEGGGLSFANGDGPINPNLEEALGEYAEGGRAEEASIFGEDGPEWAIPEEHTEHTQNLLIKAAAASGFTWPELLGRNGGLNAGTNNRETVINYSPIINAGDASGVATALQEDKNRLARMIRNMMSDIRFREEAEAFA